MVTNASVAVINLPCVDKILPYPNVTSVCCAQKGPLNGVIIYFFITSAHSSKQSKDNRYRSRNMFVIC